VDSLSFAEIIASCDLPGVARWL